MADPIRINGNTFSWGSIAVKLGGQAFTGITKIDYADKRSRSKAYGLAKSQAPRGRTRGKYETSPVVFEMHLGSAKELRSALAQRSADGKSYGNTVFQVSVQYIDEGEEPHTVEIEDCVWVEESASHSEGPDALTVTVTCDAMLIRRDGLTLFDGVAS